MYVHRVNNGKRIPQYTCANYSKMPIGTHCKSAHRIKAGNVMELVSEMIKEVIRYADVDREAFAKEIRAGLEQKQTEDFTAQKKRMAVCEKRIGELEILIAKIYEDNALGKLPDKRYEMLSDQYEKEQEGLCLQSFHKILHGSFHIRFIAVISFPHLFRSDGSSTFFLMFHPGNIGLLLIIALNCAP